MTWNYKAYSEIDVTVPNKWNPELCVELRSGLVFDGAFAGLHPGTLRYVDGSGLGNDGTLTNMNSATDWVWVPELHQFGLANFRTSGGYVDIPPNSQLGTAHSFACWVYIPARFDTSGLISSGAAAKNELRIGDRDLYLYDKAGGVVGLRITIATWIHVGYTIDGVNAILYHQGIGTPKTMSAVVEANLFNRLGRVGAASIMAGGILVAPCLWNRVISSGEFGELASRKPLYVPDTRTRLFAPLVTGWKPWLRQRQRHRLGAV
jgi:hypothetical protein